MADDHEPERPEADQEGGPVKSFLEHLEDLRWVLIKSDGRLGRRDVALPDRAAITSFPVLKWPLERAKISYPGTNQIVTVSYGTNKLGKFHLDRRTGTERWTSGSNRFVAVEVEPLCVGTNRVLGWKVNPDPATG